MAMLISDGEKKFIINAIENGVRVDGRSPMDIRPMQIELDMLPNTNGSSGIQLAGTRVLVGIKAELSAPKVDPDCGSLIFFVDCAATAIPEYEGRSDDNLTNKIQSLLTLAYQNSIDLKSLCVISGQHVWTLFVDVLIMELGGNLVDAVSFAVKAALFTLKIPKVTVTNECEGGQPEIEISDDPYDVQRLDVSKTPVLITLTKIGDTFVLDAKREEERCSAGTMVMAVNETGRILKLTAGCLHVDSVMTGLQIGKKAGIELNKALMKTVRKHEKKSGK